MRSVTCLLIRAVYRRTPWIALPLLSAPLFASVPFESEVAIRGLRGANDVLTGDLDGDGVPDLVGIGGGGGSVVYSLNGGDASTWSSFDLITNASRPRQLALADLDGDTDLDIVYTDFAEDRVYWYRNNLDTTGAFSGRRRVASLNGADGITAVDFDGDTDVDLLVAARTADAYYWLENTAGTGNSWTVHVLADDLDAPQTVRVADLDGDGDLDVLGGGAENEGSLVWLENTQGDNSEWVVHTVDATAWINVVAPADVDLDGDLDIVVQENDAAPPASDSDAVVWWENTEGDASVWVEHAIGPTGRDAAKGMQIVDLDFDGDLDVVASRDGDWFENTDGDAMAWTQHSFSDADEVFDHDVTDLDGDGDLDVVGAQLGGGFTWWESLICTLADADADSDGFRDACDVCDGFDDALDADGDTVPDGCDVCAGGDDRVDVDGEGTPDACQATGSLSIDDVTASEGDAGTTDFTFTVTLTGAVGEAFTVDYATQDGTATEADSDYAGSSGTLAFAGVDGETAQLTVSVTGDTEAEGDETFIALLDNLSTRFASILDDTGIGTIEGDDLSISIIDVTATEGDSDATDFVFTVTLTGDVTGGFTVDAQTQDGSATAASGDYASKSATLSFDGTAGETQTFSVSVSGDTLLEGDETFTVELGAPSNSDVEIAAGTGIGTITNDDAASLAISDFSAAEGDAGSVNFAFIVTLTGDVQDAFTLDAQTVDGSATAASGDYAAVSDTLSFAGIDGETETLIVSVAGDGVLEGDETFTVTLAMPTNGRVDVMDDSGLGTIDDDDQASLSIGDVTAAEGDAGTSAFSFTVALDGAVQGGFTVAAATQDGTATSASGDYAAAAGTLPFAGSEDETQVFSVDVAGDQALELDETFFVLLGAPSNASVSVTDGSGLGTIENDDSASISIDDVNLAEGDGATTDFTFTATLTGVADGAFTVPVQTQDGTATAASGDYAASSDVLSFNGTDGETQTFTVSVAGDTVVELDETFSVQLGTPSDARLTVENATALGTIENDDDASISIDDVTAEEGDVTTTNFTFTVSLAGDVQDGFTVGAETRDGSATSSSGDFAAASETLTFAGVDGESQTFTVAVNGDSVAESDEIFFALLGTPSNVAVTGGGASGLGTIENDDFVSLSIADVELAEGDSGDTIAELTVTLSGDLGSSFQVGYATRDGSATGASGDYAPAAGFLTFAGTDGETQTVQVNVQGDVMDEADETFFVDLGSVSNPIVSLAESEGQVTLLDDDLLLSVAVEGEGHILSSPSGIDCGDGGSVCAEVFPMSTAITLTPTAAFGWSFDSFSGDADCADGAVTLVADTSCTATFIALRGQLTVDFAGEGFAVAMSTPAGIDCDPVDTALCTADFQVGVDIELAVATDRMTRFDGFTGDPDCADGTVSFIADGETRTCVANLLPDPPFFADGFESGDTTGWAPE